MKPHKLQTEKIFRVKQTPPETSETVNDRFRQFRELEKLEKSDFAALLGMSRSHLSNIEGGRREVPMEAVALLIETRALDSNWLLTGKGEPKGNPKGNPMGNPTPVFQNERDKKNEAPTSAVARVSEGPAPYATGASIEVRPITVVVDERNEERIVIVEEPVFAGYQHGYGDPTFVGSLPSFVMPGYSGRTYRVFEVRGDSMMGTLHHRDLILCSYVEDWRFLRNDHIYVVVSPDAGLVVKRVTSHVDRGGRGYIVCTSDNSAEYRPFRLPTTPDFISELWQVEMRFTRHLLPPPPNPALATRVAVLEAQYQDLMERLQSPQKLKEGALFDD